jgi:Ca2+:H+ antiporter
LEDFMARWLYAMLILGPAAVVAEILGAPVPVTFVLSALGIVPLAALIGHATEALAHHLGPRAGGLLNATFGNAAELIITIFALNAGLFTLVKASITGSIIGNILLIIGFSCFLGGIRNGIQRFSPSEAGRHATMMLLAVTGLLVPAFFGTVTTDHFIIEELSVAVAIILLLLYGAYIGYSFTTAEEEKSQEEMIEAEDAAEPGSPWSVRVALAVLAGAIVATAVVSEILTGAVEPLSKQVGLTEIFVGVIIVPIVGNAAEHFSAVQLAVKNRMDVSLAIGAGSSIQIALLVGPLLVLLSLLFGKPMDLVFTPMEILVVALSTVIFNYINQDGETNWLEGIQLLAVYLIAAAAFFFLPAH